MTRKKIFKHTLIFSIALLLVSCGSSELTSDPASDKNTTETTGSVSTHPVTLSKLNIGQSIVTVPLEALGISQEELTGAILNIFRNGTIYQSNIAIAAFYKSSSNALIFTLTNLSSGDELILTFNWESFETSYKGTVSLFQNTEAELMTEGDLDDFPDSNPSESQFITFSAIDNEGNATVTIPAAVFGDHEDVLRESWIYMDVYNSTLQDIPVSEIENYYEADQDALVITLDSLVENHTIKLTLYFMDGGAFTTTIHMSTEEEQLVEVTYEVDI